MAQTTLESVCLCFGLQKTGIRQFEEEGSLQLWKFRVVRGKQSAMNALCQPGRLAVARLSTEGWSVGKKRRRCSGPSRSTVFLILVDIGRRRIAADFGRGSIDHKTSVELMIGRF